MSERISADPRCKARRSSAALESTTAIGVLASRPDTRSRTRAIEVDLRTWWSLMFRFFVTDRAPVVLALCASSVRQRLELLASKWLPREQLPLSDYANERGFKLIGRCAP